MTAGLSVMVPVTIDDSIVVSSTVPETDYPAWSAGTAYAVGDRCISTSTHRVYECLAAHTGKDPTATANQSNSTGIVYWLDYGPTNRWAMFDGEVSTQTVVASSLTVVLRPGAFNAFYLAKLEADAISITVTDAPGGAVIYSYSGSLDASRPGDYDEYFFGAFEPVSDFLASGIPSYFDARLTITLTSVSGSVKCGIVSVGDLQALGQTQYGAKAKPKTYSYIKTDEFGQTTIRRRKATTDMSATAWLDLSEANTVVNLIRGVLDVPAVWIGSELPDYGGLRCFGLGSGEISYDMPGQCQLSLTVQGMI